MRPSPDPNVISKLPIMEVVPTLVPRLRKVRYLVLDIPVVTKELLAIFDNLDLEVLGGEAFRWPLVELGPWLYRKLVPRQMRWVERYGLLEILDRFLEVLIG